VIDVNYNAFRRTSIPSPIWYIQIILSWTIKKRPHQVVYQEMLWISLWWNPYVDIHVQPKNGYPLNLTSKPTQRAIHTPTNDITWWRRNQCQNPLVDIYLSINSQIDDIWILLNPKPFFSREKNLEIIWKPILSCVLNSPK
jgi:hypothetical protein